MTRNFIATMVASVIGLGLCTQATAEDWRHQQGDRHYDWRDRNHDGQIDWRDRYDARDRNHDGRVDGRDGYGPSPTYRNGGACTFQTQRGPMTGYKPEGKDRCCIETRNGPSCQ